MNEKEKMVNCNNTIERFIKVKCISERSSFKNQIIIGKVYIIDRDSLYIDNDGDIYIDVYEVNYNLIGRMNINHFVVD